MTAPRRVAPRALVLGAPLLWMALIFAGSSIPGRRVPVPGGWDKLAHATEYAVLGWLAQRALREAGLRPGRAALVAAAAAAAYGLSDEWHQSFVPNRSVEAADAVADAAGGLAGAAAAWAVARRRRGPSGDGAPRGNAEADLRSAGGRRGAPAGS